MVRAKNHQRHRRNKVPKPSQGQIPERNLQKLLRAKLPDCLALDQPQESVVENSRYLESHDRTATGSKKPSIENHEIGELIAEGGMGSVWKAEQTKPVRRQVAIKVIKRNIADKETIARFEVERKHLR